MKINKNLREYKKLIIFISIILILLVVLIIKKIYIYNINIKEINFDINQAGLSKIPSVLISSNNKNNKVNTGTQIDYKAQFHYYGDDTFYYKWLTFNKNNVKSVGVCKKLFNDAVSDKKVIITSDNQFVAIGIYTDNSCKDMASIVYSKNYNITSIPTFSTKSQRSKIIDKNSDAEVDFEINKPMFTKYYYRILEYKDNVITDTTSCEEISKKRLKRKLNISNNYNYISVEVFDDNLCINRVGKYYSNTYILSSLKANSIDIIGNNKVKINSSEIFKSKTFPSDGLKGTIWYSSDKSIATVNSLGLVAGLKQGKVNICVKLSYDYSINKCKSIEIIK